MINAILEYAKQRSVSTFLVSFTVFWAIQHWDGIYMTLFTSQELIYQTKDGLLKNEYAKEFFGMDWGSIESWWENILFPALLALLYVLVFPLFVNLIYRAEAWYKMNRKITWEKQQQRFEEVKRKGIKEKSKSVDAQIELSKKQAEVSSMDPEIRWNEQYKEFLGGDASMAFSILDELKTVMYTHNGYFGTTYGDRYISEDSLMVCDTNGLISFDSKINRKITLTDKGKYFLRQYSLEKIK